MSEKITIGPPTETVLFETNKIVKKQNALIKELVDALEKAHELYCSYDVMQHFNDSELVDCRFIDQVLAKFKAFKEGNADPESGDRQTICEPDVCPNCGSTYTVPTRTKQFQKFGHRDCLDCDTVYNPDTDNAGGDDE